MSLPFMLGVFILRNSLCTVFFLLGEKIWAARSDALRHIVSSMGVRIFNPIVILDGQREHLGSGGAQVAPLRLSYDMEICESRQGSAALQRRTASLSLITS